jgi:hypothetical protein
MNRDKLMGYGLPRRRKKIWRQIKVEIDDGLLAEASMAAERAGTSLSVWMKEILKKDVDNWSRLKLARRIHLHSRPIASISIHKTRPRIGALMKSVERSRRPLFIRSPKGDMVMAAAKKPWHR